MLIKLEYKISGGDFTRAGHASSEVKKTLKELGVDPRIIRRVVVAMYEAEVNIVAHAYAGQIKVEIESNRIRIVLADKGPGIPDLELAMKEGFSTASQQVREMGFGAGMGLPNMKKNSDILNITSKVDEGTTVEIINQLHQ